MEAKRTGMTLRVGERQKPPGPGSPPLPLESKPSQKGTTGLGCWRTRWVLYQSGHSGSILALRRQRETCRQREKKADSNGMDNSSNGHVPEPVQWPWQRSHWLLGCR